MAERTGLAAVLDDAGPDVLGRGMLAPSDQLDLIGDGDPHAAVKAARQAEAIALASRRGRPKGSRNKRVQDWADYLLGRYRSPLVVMAETYSRPVAELAAELGCSRLEAATMQMRAASELAPYIHGKQPVKVDLDAAGAITLVIPGVNAPLAPVEDLVARLELGDLIEAEQNQSLSEVDR